MLSKNFSHETEIKWQKYWQESEIYQFDDSKPKTQNPKPIYSIDTPPPFTSGELHMGHVLSYSYFDFIARYKRMQGFNVYYPQGWDTQGFPTEVKVEKKFGRLPPVEFRQKCIEWTHEFIAKMKQQMIEMGFSPDWRFEYRTMDTEYHRKVQLSLIQMYDKKLVYRSEYPVYWCPRCVSALAKAELDEEEKDGVIYDIKFTGPKGEDLTIATTRPELITACVAVMFNPNDERYKKFEGKKAKTALGKEVPIIADRDVDKEFGTGLIQVSTFGDKMDVVWMHRHKLPIVNCIDKYGKMQNAGELDGLKVADARKKIVEKLEKEAKITKKKNLRQTVKVHDRCKTMVELIPSKQWFADIKNKAKEIKQLAQKVKWFPDFGITYLIDWVENVEWDWVISRQRVFGTPLPFYYCEKCEETSAAVAGELPFYAEKAKSKKCKCGNAMQPETSTADCWIDSSITPLIIAGWPDNENKEKFAKLYPNSLRPQGVEIVRTWAFYTIYRSGVALTGKAPWETIMLNGNVLAPDGKKMSKSLGNIISPADLLREYPADAIRQWSAMSGAMAKDRPFSYEDMKYAKSFLIKLWNASNFVSQATADMDKGEKVNFKKLHTIDRWMVSRTNQLILEYTKHFENFEYQSAISKLHNFFWHDFCDNYLEYVKHRIYGNDKDAKKAAQHTLIYVLLNSIKLLAPVIPHITEELYHEIFGKEAKKTKSIHLSEWPKADEVDESAIAEMEIFNKLISEIRQYKAKNKLAQNAELAAVSISLEKPLSNELVEELKAIAKIKAASQKKGEFKVEI